MKFPFFGSKSWSISGLTPPWGDRKSIYWHIANHIEEDSLGLTEGGEELPDEQLVRGNRPFSWAAGALDGLFGSTGEGNEAEMRVSELFDAIVDITEKSSDRNLVRFYQLATSGNVLGIVDHLLEKIAYSSSLQKDRLHTVARWLAMESADREVVKLAISILGLFRDENDFDLLMKLGRHEEFTLYVTVAIQNSGSDVDNRLWKLAQHVRGWGRVNIVERLAMTNDDYIRDWLVREGYQNDIMLEYTALICARAGELHRKLKEEKVDDELVKAAGEILTALLSGSGPAECYESYNEGPGTFEVYLDILAGRENEIEALVFAGRMEGFLNDPESFSDLPADLKSEWQNRTSGMLASVSRIKNQPSWEEKIREQLTAENRVEFWIATEGAKVFGIDTWNYFFDRIKNGEDYWWDAMQTDDPTRIDLLVEYAEKTLPLETIATGPSDALGLGPEFADHQKLDWLLQDLRRFPGKGLRLVHAGLNSPVVRNRNMAVRAIAEIPLEERTEKIKKSLADACLIEPNEETRKIMESTIRGERTDD